MTVVIIYCPKLPLLGLYWLMYNLIILLNVKDIYHSFGFSNKLLPQISCYFIANAIKGIHFANVEHIFEDSDFFP